MAFYLRFPDSTGDPNTNTMQLAISGISGALTRVRYTVAENSSAYTEGRYLVDGRLNSVGGSTAPNFFFLQFGATSTDATGFTTQEINGVFSTAAGVFNNPVVDDVVDLILNQTPSDGVISFGARFNQVEANYGLAVFSIEITDAAGVHTFDFADVTGTQTTISSSDAALTGVINNPPAANAQWVSYGTSVTTTGPHSVGDAFSYTVTGLGTITTATLTDSNANVLTLTSVSDTGATIPDFTTGGQQGCLLGDVTLTVGDGTDTATTTFELQPKTGFAYVVASGLTVPSVTETDWNFGTWTEEPIDGDATYYPNDTVIHAANGSTDVSGVSGSYTYTYFVIDQSTGILAEVDKTFAGEGGSVVNRGTSICSIRIGL